MADIDAREAACKKIFNLFDKDGSGSIDAQELGNGLRALGTNPTEEEIATMMEEGDSQLNSNGKLEFMEFYELMKKYSRGKEEEQQMLENAFKLFDKNGDGLISKQELREVLTSMGMSKLTVAEVNELFSDADTDDSGTVDYRELVQMILR